MTGPLPPPDERGTALVGSLVGVVIFLVFLFAAVQLLTRLYAASTLTAITTHAARSVASREVDHRDAAAVVAAEAAAEAQARHDLGAYGRGVRFEWAVAGGAVRLRVRVDNPRTGFGDLAGLGAFAHVDRTVVLRLEGEP